MPVQSTSTPLYDQLVPEGSLPRKLLEFLYGSKDEMPMPGMPMVAMGGPSAIPYLKAHGARLIEKLKQGARLRVPNTEEEMDIVNPAVIEALEFAQKRWPRVFGHIQEIISLPSDRIPAKTVGGKATVTRGAQQAIGVVDPSKVSRLQLNPVYADVDTVGHELHHVADNLVNPKKFREAYDFANTLPGGYAANSHEVRARNMGDLLLEYLAGAPRKKGQLRGYEP